jgi:hypothetical protein
MPSELLDDLHLAAGPDRAPTADAYRLGLVRLQAEMSRPRRHRARLAVAAVALCAAGLVAVAAVPGRTPGASEILQRAAAAVTPGDGVILFAESRSLTRAADGSVERFGTRRAWVRDGAVRLLYVSGPNAGAEEVTRPGPVTERYSPATGRVTVDHGAWIVPGDIFRARDLLRRAHAGADVELRGETTIAGRAAYELTWEEPSPPGHRVVMTLWVDAETYAPLRFTDHGQGTNEDGPYDQTFVETVTAFERMPDTAANRRLLEMGAG